MIMATRKLNIRYQIKIFIQDKFPALKDNQIEISWK